MIAASVSACSICMRGTPVVQQMFGTVVVWHPQYFECVVRPTGGVRVTWVVSLMTQRRQRRCRLRRFDPRSQGRARLGQGDAARLASLDLWTKGPLDAGLSILLTRSPFMFMTTFNVTAVAALWHLAHRGGCAKAGKDEQQLTTCAWPPRKKDSNYGKQRSPPKQQSNIQASTGRLRHPGQHSL